MGVYVSDGVYMVCIYGVRVCVCVLYTHKVITLIYIHISETPAVKKLTPHFQHLSYDDIASHLSYDDIGLLHVDDVFKYSDKPHK